MSNFWNDSLKANLKKASDFYRPKVWSIDHNKIWQDALKGYKAEEITQAFEDYYRSSAYMPKPSEIIKIMRYFSPQRTNQQPEAEHEPLPDCNEIIASAWIRFNFIQNGFELKFEAPEPGTETKRVRMTDCQAILICNLEAKRCRFPDAIQEAFWLFDVWGKAKAHRTSEQRLAASQTPKPNKQELGPVPDYSYLFEGSAA
jgi:hypothetical protein